MGREVRRVPLDFDWPLNEVWKGFMPPPETRERCHDPGCRNGYTSARQRVEELLNLLMLSADDARRGKCHPYLYHTPPNYTAGEVVSPEIHELVDGLSKVLDPDSHGPGFGGYSYGTLAYQITNKLAEVAGLPKDWGICKACEGHGETAAARAAYEAWESEDPPEGDGYQIWETVSEGSPISPVFATPEELAKHMTTTRWGADKGTSYESWLKFITGPGWAPSLIVDNGVVMDGVTAVTREDDRVAGTVGD